MQLGIFLLLQRIYCIMFSYNRYSNLNICSTINGEMIWIFHILTAKISSVATRYIFFITKNILFYVFLQYIFQLNICSTINGEMIWILHIIVAKIRSLVSRYIFAMNNFNLQRIYCILFSKMSKFSYFVTYLWNNDHKFKICNRSFIYIIKSLTKNSLASVSDSLLFFLPH